MTRFPCGQTCGSPCPCAGPPCWGVSPGQDEAPRKSGQARRPSRAAGRVVAVPSGGAGATTAAPHPASRPGTHLSVRLQLSVPVVHELHDRVHGRGRVKVVRQGSLHSLLGVAEPGRDTGAAQQQERGAGWSLPGAGVTTRLPLTLSGLGSHVCAETALTASHQLRAVRYHGFGKSL